MLTQCIQIFKEQTKLFSQAEVPLLHQTLPELLLMKHALEDVRDDADDLSPLTRVAACSALMVYDKYAAIMEESEMYYLAVGKRRLT